MVDRYPVEVCVEQAGLHVERHSGRSVAEHALYRLHAGSRRHRERGGCMAQLVRRQTMETRIVGCLVEHVTSEAEIPRWLAAPRREHQGVRW
jgi:hypothetical protein